MHTQRRRFTDHLGQEVEIDHPPRRIVCLVPSITETLFDLGMSDEVVGITKFCIHPQAMVKGKTIVGGTKNVHIDRVQALQPDLILACKEENEKSQIDLLRQIAPVWVADVGDLNGALGMITDLGQLLDKPRQAIDITTRIRQGFSGLNQHTAGQPDRKVLYLIWRKPYMVAGKGTFISDMIGHCGWTNLGDQWGERYPEISLDQINNLRPDFLFLSSEPYPFKEKHRVELMNAGVQGKISIVDGEKFSWFGSHLQYAGAYFYDLINGLNAT